MAGRFLFLISLFMSLQAWAADYKFTMDIFYYGYSSSALAACQKYGVTSSPPYTGHSVVNTGSEEIYYCYASHGGAPIEVVAPVQRYGDSCPNGGIFFPSIGECVGDSQTGGLQKGSPDMCPSAVSGASINSAIANTFQVETDFQNSSVYSIQFLRTYNSLDGLWRHNYSTHLMVTGTVIALVMADGRESFFSFDGTTAVAAPTELGQLTKTGDIWLYTAKNSDTYSFDATGRLTRWTNAAGAEQLLDYVNGTVTVTDNLGKSLSFTEDAQHQPLTLSAPGLTIQYDYNANQRLSGLTRTRGGEAEQRQFHYEDASNNALLTGITDERGVRYVTWAYDDQDRAISSEYAGGAGSSMVTYNADGSSTITNEFGKKATYRFQDINGIRRVSAIEGEALGSCPNSNSTYSYDTRGLITSKIDNMGIYTSYDYNERGLEISRTEAAGTPQARTITTTWHATLNLPLMVTEPGRITTYTYDAQGRQLSQTNASTAL